MQMTWEHQAMFILCFCGLEFRSTAHMKYDFVIKDGNKMMPNENLDVNNVGVDWMKQKCQKYFLSVRCSTWICCNIRFTVQIVPLIEVCECASPARKEVRVAEKNPLKVYWLFLFSWHCWLQLPTSTQRNHQRGCTRIEITDMFQNFNWSWVTNT